MVVITPCNPTQLHAYPTLPVTEDVINSVQHDFAIGSFARFGNPCVTISIQDRPDFHGASHYSIREKLDLEGFLEDFLVVDDRTAESHAIWYVETTESSKLHTALATEAGDPPVTYEGENFPVWHARILTQDLPIQWACFYAAVRDINDDIRQYTHPYDSRNPQDDPFTLGLDFANKEDADAFVPDAYLTATFEEVDWSTDVVDRRFIAPLPPVVVKLTEEAASVAGLLRPWRSARQIPRPGDTISLSAPYDWDSPRWSQNGTSLAKRGRRGLSLISPVVDESVGSCQSRSVLGPGLSRIRTLAGVSNF